MNRTPLRLLSAALALVPPAAAQEAPAEPDPVLAALRAEAVALAPLVQTDFARAFLEATAALPAVAPRRVFTNADRSRWLTAAQAEALAADERAGLTERTLDASFYWNTRYGSPLSYARALDIAAQHGAAQQGLPARAAVADFGCGGLGAARLLASLGCAVAGVDVDPLLPALYAEPGDTGAVPAAGRGASGRLALVTGAWPAEPAAVQALRAALPDGADLFLSKNTLKNGYLHPAQPVDPRKLVHLGVEDEAFVAAVAGLLRPGGLFLVYNLCPAPAAEGEPYIPWADGRCPFPRAMLEAAGLEVLAFDQVDDEAARALGHALGWDAGEGGMRLDEELFAWFTLARRPMEARAPK
jgi:SAM-dependent methyltransferase